MNYAKLIHRIARQGLIVSFAVWFSVAAPAGAWAQGVVDESTAGNTSTTDAVESTGPQSETGATEATGATEPTGAQACTGAGCTQGLNQGLNQGVNQGLDQGGPTLQQLGAIENEDGELVLPAGVQNTTQGAQQGTSSGVSATNENTGAQSTNTAQLNAATGGTAAVSNTATDTTNADATANTGGNTGNSNTSNGPVKTGDANIGVTQVKNDNTAALNGNVGINATGHNGTHQGDLEVDFANAMSLLTGDGQGRSIRAVNDTTGQGSTNDVLLSTLYEEINEVQNDGTINNDLGLNAITGQNEASMNTGNGEITTGNANIAATLVNLLNTTVINGNLAIAVHDIFGDLVGNVNIPDLGQLATLLGGGSSTTIDASNDNTGSDSTNNIDVNLTDNETTQVQNDADINTTVDANAITGQNEATANTGGSQIHTGDGSVQASNISVANTTVEGGNWGLVIVNALNKWLGFLVGDNGETRQLTQEETIREIEARNANTGAESDNNIVVNDETNRVTDVHNDATINNNILANAITGQNEASKNTGAGIINTGNANVLATAVNIANTTVKNANLGIAVINVFGNWFGDLMYGGQALLAGVGGGGDTTAEIAANNTDTGATSENTIDVNINRRHETDIDNNADINTVLNANIDTGNNKANKNTKAGEITTGDGLLALHSRAIANITGVTGPGSLELTVTGGNENTGFDSQNRINAQVNDERIVTVNNDANVSTFMPANVNTGNNEASMNTGGGVITTGDIEASAAIDNLVNRLIVAMGGAVALGEGSGLTLNADLFNRLTGAESENTNEVDVARSFLLDIFNNATVENIIDFLLNTGGNKANLNTGGGHISTGEICVDGKIVNDVNSVSGKKAATALNLFNTGEVFNRTLIDAVTGNNEVKMNTGEVDGIDKKGDCEKVAVKPPEEEKPPVGGGPVEEEKPGPGGEGGEGGGEEEKPLPKIARVAGVQVAKAAEEVKKAINVSRLAPTGEGLDRTMLLWIVFGVTSAAGLAYAVRSDHKHKHLHLAHA